MKTGEWLQLGTLLTTGIGAGAAIVAAWQTQRTWPSPEWSLEDSWRGFVAVGHQDRYGTDGDMVRCTLTNCGDGPAFDVRLGASGCDLYRNHSSFDWLPKIEPGEQVAFLAKMHTLNGARIVLTWHQPPRRRKTRGPLRFPLNSPSR